METPTAEMKTFNGTSRILAYGGFAFILPFFYGAASFATSGGDFILFLYFLAFVIICTSILAIAHTVTGGTYISEIEVAQNDYSHEGGLLIFFVLFFILFFTWLWSKMMASKGQK
jgi:membrane protein DedA with SNARE-associated domain